MIYFTLVLLGALFTGATISGDYNRPVFFALGLGVYALQKRFNVLTPQRLKVIAYVFFSVIVLDFFRLLPTPDTEIYIGGLAHRPFLFHPNLMAAWMLLLPWGWYTPLTALLCTSRGAILGYGAAWFAKRHMSIPWIAIVLLIAVSLGILVFLRPATVTSRFDLYADAWRMFASSPLIGVGNAQRYGIEQAYTAHNAALTIAAENGLLGLVPFVGFVVGIYRRVRQSNSPAKWGLLAFAIQQLVDDQWLDPISASLIGVVLDEADRNNPNRDT